MVTKETDMENQWRVWERDHSVELRTYQRVRGELPEMECTKQLVDLVKDIYIPGDTILDVGCAAGHYYRSLATIDPNLKYKGVDATKKYINFANDFYQNNDLVQFYVGDIFDLNTKLLSSDIVFCCNVILHLPDFRIPLSNLLKAI